MGSEAAMANTPAPAVARDAGGKKKRTNRAARLKQCKLDARREQWLSQVKNKDCNEHRSPPSMAPSPLILPPIGKKASSLGGSNPEASSRREGRDGPTGLHDCDPDSPMNSPMSSFSGNISSRRDCPSSSISSGSYSRSASDADEGDEDVDVEGGSGGGLDDWEAVADALNGDDKSPLSSKRNVALPVPIGSMESRNGDGILKKPVPDRTTTRAWRPDDVFRPQSLPILSKQHSFPLHHSRGTMGWAHHSITSQPSSCPICYEDLDLTDSSFLPCSCGFRLCLFCHKRILESDGRCPGCREQYIPVGGGEVGMSGSGMPLLSLRLSRSCRLSLRS